MVIKKSYITKAFKKLIDMSVFRLVREYNTRGERRLKTVPTFFDTLWCKLRYGITTKLRQAKKKLGDFKYNTYLAYKEYYRREAICIDLPSESEKMVEFANQYGSFILKPLNMSQGRGICFWTKDMDYADDVLAQLKENLAGKVVLEEIIFQDPEMAAFHPSSVKQQVWTGLFRFRIRECCSCQVP